jgi:23S rRNA pseudouridine1911/1915/1917 synthase
VRAPGEPVTFRVPREASGARLDRFLAGVLAVSRSELQRWIEAGRVRVGEHGDGTSPASPERGRNLTPATRLKEGDDVVVDPLPRATTQARPQAEVAFQVLFVDEHVIVVDKPPGLVVHPAKGHEEGTLVNGLLALGLFREDVEGGDVRPGIVHRLDKGTSGVMVVARTAAAREGLKAQFQEHTIERAYEAIVVGEATARTFATLHGRHPRDRKRFTTRVRTGKRAVTHTKVLARLAGATHLACTLETGRTHQIRVHLAESGTPVLGDPVYGKPPRDPHVREVGERLGHQALHARILGFTHPATGACLRFEVAPPEDFRVALESL